MPELKDMVMLNAKCRMLNIIGDPLPEVEIDTLVDTLVERQTRIQVKSIKTHLRKKRNRICSTHWLLGFQR